MKTRTARLAAPAVALSLFLAACGDDDDDASEDTTVVEDTVEETTTTEAPDPMDDMDDMDDMEDMEADPAGDDIVDTAVAAGDFTTLVAAVQAAGLEDTLRSEGPFTVFAPTDDAFAALPDGTVDGLLADPEGALTDVLTYHVVEGEVLAADVADLDGQEVTTVAGGTFTVNVGDDGSVTLTDATGAEVTVTMTDITTSNGVIHVIDGVLLPG